MRMFIFVGALVVFTAGLIIIGQQGERVRYRLPTLWGSVVTLVAGLFLPWVQFSGPDYFIGQVQQLKEWAEMIPGALWLGQWSGAPDFLKMALSGDVEQWLAWLPPGAREYGDFALHDTPLTAYHLARTLSQVDGLLQVTAWLVFLLPTAALLWSGL